MVAAKSGHHLAVKGILEQGANVNLHAVNPDRHPALGIACFYMSEYTNKPHNHPASGIAERCSPAQAAYFRRLPSPDYVETVRELLRARADPNFRAAFSDEDDELLCPLKLLFFEARTAKTGTVAARITELLVASGANGAVRSGPHGLTAAETGKAMGFDEAAALLDANGRAPPVKGSWRQPSGGAIRKPWVGGGRASEQSTDEVLAKARGGMPAVRSFRILDFPQLGTPTLQAVGFEKGAIRDLSDIELEAWLADRSLQPIRVGMKRAERELLAMMVRKLPCEGEALECAHEAFFADAALAAGEEDELTDQIAASSDPSTTMLQQLDRWLTQGKPVWLCGLGKDALNGRCGVVAGGRVAESGRYPVELHDEKGGERLAVRLAVRPHNLRPGAPPSPLSSPAPAESPAASAESPAASAAAAADSVEAALADTLGADVAGLVLEKSFAAAVEAADAEAEKELTAEGQWRQWHLWTTTRVCYATLEAATPGTAGGGLCARCRLAWYATASAQRAHWPFHKKVCGVPKLARVGAMESSACVAELQRTLSLGTPNADTAAVMYRLGHLLKTGGADDADDVGFQLHGFARGLMARYPEQAWEYLWAVPGMPQLMLSEPLLSRSSMRRELIERAVGRAAMPDEEDEFELELGDRGAYEYCFLLFNLLLGSGHSSIATGFCSAHDGARATPRDSDMAEAARRRSLQLWLDPSVRRDCGDAMGPAASFALAAFTRSSETERATLLMSGIGEACLDELEQSGAGARQYARALLGGLCMADWKTFARGMYRERQLTKAATAAVSLAMAALRHLHAHEGDSDGLGDSWQDDDSEMLEQVVGGCLQVNVINMAPLTDEQKRQRTVRLRTRLLELGAGRGASSWEEASARDEVRFGIMARDPSQRALLSSTGAKACPKVRDLSPSALPAPGR